MNLESTEGMDYEQLEDRLRNEWTKAALSAEKALEVPNGLMSFASDERGAPSKAQQSLYLAAVTFAYAVWESYAEDVAIEIVESLAPRLDPASIPGSAKDALSTKDAWQLAVNPGWRGLWVEAVDAAAKGGKGAGYGINTANFKNVHELFSLVGIGDALPTHLPVDSESRLGKIKGRPPHVGVTKNETINVEHCLSLLISLRGQAVHTARTETKLLKKEVIWWTTFIRELHEESDRKARGAAARLLGL